MTINCWYNVLLNWDCKYIELMWNIKQLYGYRLIICCFRICVPEFRFRCTDGAVQCCNTAWTSQFPSATLWRYHKDSGRCTRVWWSARSAQSRFCPSLFIFMVLLFILFFMNHCVVFLVANTQKNQNYKHPGENFPFERIKLRIIAVP